MTVDEKMELVRTYLEKCDELNSNLAFLNEYNIDIIGIFDGVYSLTTKALTAIVGQDVVSWVEWYLYDIPELNKVNDNLEGLAYVTENDIKTSLFKDYAGFLDYLKSLCEK